MYRYRNLVLGLYEGANFFRAVFGFSQKRVNSLSIHAPFERAVTLLFFAAFGGGSLRRQKIEGCDSDGVSVAYRSVSFLGGYI